MDNNTFLQSNKIVLRCPQTHRYVADGLDWTCSLLAASSFPSARAAQQFCLDWKLSGLDIWLLRQNRTPMRYPLSAT